MKAFPAAVVASILTERALILECPFDHQAIGISNMIGWFFPVAPTASTGVLRV
jgi:hypothetical protein